MSTPVSTTLEYRRPPARVSKIALTALIWALLAVPLGVVFKHTILDSAWFIRYHNVMGATTLSSNPGHWIARFSHREIFFGYLVLLEVIGALLGLLAQWRTQKLRLRGHGIALAALVLSIVLAALTIMRFLFLEITDFHLGL